MSLETDEERWSRIFLSEPAVARITPDLVEKALEGFPLEPDRDMAWLARAIQPAVYYATKADYPTKQGHTATRDELKQLGDRATALWSDIFKLSDEAREQIDRYIWSPWIEGDEEASPDDIEPQQAAWNSAQRELYWLASFLRGAAKYVGAKKQATKWQASAKMYWRMQFAVWLAPAFQGGFGKKPGLTKHASTNAWGLKRSGGRSLGHWADFYQRIMAAAFNERATPNLAEVLRQALKRDMPQFGAGMFPE